MIKSSPALASRVLYFAAAQLTANSMPLAFDVSKPVVEFGQKPHPLGLGRLTQQIFPMSPLIQETIKISPGQARTLGIREFGVLQLRVTLNG